MKVELKFVVLWHPGVNSYQQFLPSNFNLVLFGFVVAELPSYWLPAQGTCVTHEGKVERTSFKSNDRSVAIYVETRIPWCDRSFSGRTERFAALRFGQSPLFWLPYGRKNPETEDQSNWIISIGEKNCYVRTYNGSNLFRAFNKWTPGFMDPPSAANYGTLVKRPYGNCFF